MADLNVKNKWLVPETNPVKKKWLECQMQERRSRIAKLKQEIEDLINGRVIELEGQIMMFEKELDKLKDDYNSLDNVIDINTQK